MLKKLHTSKHPIGNLNPLIFGLMTALVLPIVSGCSTYKKYSTDEISPQIVKEVEQLYKDKTLISPKGSQCNSDQGIESNDLVPQYFSSEDVKTLGALNWKEFFTNKKLQHLIELGLKNNSDLQIAQLRSQEAEAILKGAKLSYFPTLSFSAQGNGTRFDGMGSKTYNLALTSDWELDIFGKQTNLKRGAQMALESAVQYKRAVRTALIATIANTYYSLVMLEQQLAIAKKTLESWTEMEHSLEALKRVGSASDPAILQTRANRLALENTIEELELQKIKVQNALFTTLGKTPYEVEELLQGHEFVGHEIVEKEVNLSIDLPMDITVGIPVLLLSNRPEVQQAEAELAQAFYATNEAKAAFYPTVTLSGTLGFTDAAGDAIIDPGKWLLSAIASVTQPLFARRQLKANLEVAKARQSQAQIGFRQSLLEAGREVNDAMASMQSCQRRILKGEQQIDVLKEAVRKTELLMRHSSTDYLQVLTARQDLLAAEQQLLEDRFEYVQALINLFHALGGGAQD